MNCYSRLIRLSECLLAAGEYGLYFLMPEYRPGNSPSQIENVSLLLHFPGIVCADDL